MKLASWNVNSINARLENVCSWLRESGADLVFVQEIKCINDNFPFEAVEQAGYKSVVQGQKSYNGVALLHKENVNVISTKLSGDDADEQARYIEVEKDGVHFINIYLPNGNGDPEKYVYKLAWMDRLKTRIKTLLEQDTPFVIGGDFNVIPQEEDCYNPADWVDDALFKIETRQKFRELLYLGLTDAFRVKNDKAEQYTFWDYQAGRWPKNEGIRIDHFLTSPELTDKIIDCKIDKDPRSKEKPSDHTPILLELDL